MIARTQSGLEVDLVAGRERTEGRTSERFRYRVECERTVDCRRDRETDATDGDGVSDGDVSRGLRCFDRQTNPVWRFGDACDTAALSDDSGEHRRIVTVPARRVTDM